MVSVEEWLLGYLFGDFLITVALIALFLLAVFYFKRDIVKILFVTETKQDGKLEKVRPRYEAFIVIFLLLASGFTFVSELVANRLSVVFQTVVRPWDIFLLGLITYAVIFCIIFLIKKRGRSKSS